MLFCIKSDLKINMLNIEFTELELGLCVSFFLSVYPTVLLWVKLEGLYHIHAYICHATLLSRISLKISDVLLQYYIRVDAGVKGGRGWFGLFYLNRCVIF